MLIGDYKVFIFVCLRGVFYKNRDNRDFFFSNKVVLVEK